jgi:hypothetical protein
VTSVLPAEATLRREYKPFWNSLRPPITGRIGMFATGKIPHSKLHVINSPLQNPGQKLTAADIVRLKEKWTELVFVLRNWHGYGRARADSETEVWLHGHS